MLLNILNIELCLWSPYKLRFNCVIIIWCILLFLAKWALTCQSFWYSNCVLRHLYGILRMIELMNLNPCFLGHCLIGAVSRLMSHHCRSPVHKPLICCCHRLATASQPWCPSCLSTIYINACEWVSFRL